MSRKEKYYVVWQGKQPGIYATWEECLAQVHQVAGAMYKAFKTLDEARQALASPPADYYTLAERKPVATEANEKASKKNAATPRLKANHLQNPPDWRHDTVLPLPPEVEAQALAVDAACSGNPGQMEYRGVDLRTGAEVFRFGPIYGTNNIGEFLAIVHGLALLCKQPDDVKTIYSDSRNAMLWIRGRKCKTTLTRNARSEKLYQLIDRAEKWLSENDWSHIELKKWQTDKWGEIPADFGRK